MSDDPKTSFEDQVKRRQKKAEPETPDPVTPNTDDESPAASSEEKAQPEGDRSDGSEVPSTPPAVAPPSVEIVAPTVVEPGDPSAPYRAMDRADEVQIIEEIEGRMSDILVYKIPTGTDLSFAGVREAVRLLVEQTGRQIRVGDREPVVERYDEDGQSFVRVSVYAEDASSGQGYWGTAEQPARMKLRADTANKYRKSKKYVADDDTVRDEFAFTKALSKAQRNALKYFLPEQIRQGVIALATNDPKKLREITIGPGAPAADAPKPLDTPAGKELIDECSRLYRAMCDIDATFKTRKPPGQFHASLQAAWSNLTALESLRDSLQDALGKMDKAA